MIYTPDNYLDTLEPAPGYYYNEELADGVMNWFKKYLSFTSGEWLGKQFNFIPWQEKILRILYGFVDYQGNRQYKTVFIFVPKKNGKTELSSGVALYHLIADNEPAPEVYSIASNVDQAKLSWEGSKIMIEQNHILQKAGLASKHNPLRIISPLNKGMYRVLSSIARGKQGLRPSTVICDEMHEWRGREIYDALTHPNATMTRRQPLVFIITTAGHNENLCNEIFAKAMRIQSGEETDHTFLPAVWCTDNTEDEWQDVDTARQVNPGWGYTIKEDVIKNAITKAQSSELEEDNYKMWTLNIFLRKNSRKWLPMKEWDRTALQDYNPEHKSLIARMTELFENDKVPKYSGLDFAPLRDLTSITHVVRDPETQNVFMKQRSWCTELEADRKTKSESIPFNKWSTSGWLTILPEKVIEPEAIGEYLLMESLLTNIHVLAYDAYRIGATIEKLVSTRKLKTIAVDIPNTTRSLNEASTTLADLITTGRLYHLDDPLLRYAADNATCKVDHAGLIKPDKSSKVEKIDPIVAGIYAIDCMIREESKGRGEVIPFKPMGSTPMHTHKLSEGIGATV